MVVGEEKQRRPGTVQVQHATAIACMCFELEGRPLGDVMADGEWL